MNAVFVFSTNHFRWERKRLISYPKIFFEGTVVQNKQFQRINLIFLKDKKTKWKFTNKIEFNLIVEHEFLFSEDGINYL